MINKELQSVLALWAIFVSIAIAAVSVDSKDFLSFIGFNIFFIGGVLFVSEIIHLSVRILMRRIYDVRLALKFVRLRMNEGREFLAASKDHQRIKPKEVGE